MTKNEYATQSAAIMKRIALTQAILTKANVTDGASLLAPTQDATQNIWNMFHDLAEILFEELNDLEDMWETRHWTSQDWQSWQLIASNVD